MDRLKRRSESEKHQRLYPPLFQTAANPLILQRLHLNTLSGSAGDTEPPIWAQSYVEHVKAKERAARDGVSPDTKQRINGRQPDRPVKAEVVNGHQLASTSARPPPIAQVEFRGDGPLGPWEPSILGYRPYEEVPKRVADWLFLQVVTRPDAGELASRGVEIEIEAKLGQLIAKDTNERFWLPVESECILANSGNVSFKSSMTEVRKIYYLGIILKLNV